MPDVADLRRAAWEDAMLTLLVERPQLGDNVAELLAAIVNEANDALTRLKERGLLDIGEEVSDGNGHHGD